LLCAIAIATALCWLLLSVAATVNQLPNQIAATRQQLLTLTDKQLTAAIADADKQIGALRVDAGKQIGAIRKDAMAELGAAGAAVNARSAEALGKVDKIQADIDRLTDATVRNVDGIHSELSPTLQNLAAASSKGADIATHVDDALPPFTDCAYLDDAGNPVGGNPDCVFNRYQGASKAFEKTMQAIAAAAPGVSSSAESISKSVAREADSLTKPQTFWQGLKSWLLVVSRCLGFFI